MTPYQNCYLKIFLFEDSKTGYQLYPNPYDRPTLLPQHVKLSFPLNAEFTIEKSSPRPTETNRLVFVFTKSERPFYHSTTSREEIERWMTAIPNNEKFISFTTIDIRDK